MLNTLYATNSWQRFEREDMTKKKELVRCNHCWKPVPKKFLMSSFGAFCSEECSKEGPRIIKEGDKVRVFLDKEIEKAKSGKKKDWTCPGVLELWEFINGHTGVVTNIVSDEEIWVRGDRTQKERMFNKNTLVKP